MAEEFLKNSDQHLQMTLAVTNTITHLMENKCKWMLRSQKYHLDRWKRPESKSCCTILSKLVSKMIEIQLVFDVVYFLLSNLYFYTYFHLSPLLDHHFLVFEEGRLLNISAEKLVVPKSEKAPISHVIWDFSPVVWPFSDSENPHSLTSQKCWCLNKKSYKEEMLSSFSTFSYNLTTEILAF